MLRPYRTCVLFSIAALALCSCASVSPRPYIDASDYPQPVRVACVGDSITYGAGIEDREHNCYPVQLGRLLGDDWDVRNFGVNGATLLKSGDNPYWKLDAYRDAMAFQPDVVIIKLGTNDTKPQNWQLKDQYVDDYVALVKSFQRLDSKPRVYVCYPVPAFPGKWGIIDTTVREEVIPRIDIVAERTDAPIIDLYATLSGKGTLFPDTVHPNAEGARLMAEAIYQALTGSEVVPSQ